MDVLTVEFLKIIYMILMMCASELCAPRSEVRNARTQAHAGMQHEREQLISSSSRQKCAQENGKIVKISRGTVGASWHFSNRKNYHFDRVNGCVRYAVRALGILRKRERLR